tara:strand:+ start:14102 stop:14356 length:255 start_codon:yes stop_codon:yes gene_type:complete
MMIGIAKPHKLYLRPKRAHVANVGLGAVSVAGALNDERGNDNAQKGCKPVTLLWLTVTMKGKREREKAEDRLPKRNLGGDAGAE